MRNVSCYLFALVFTASFLYTAAEAQTRELERESLRSLEGFALIVEALHSDAEEIGLSREDLAREALYRLRRAGLDPLGLQERLLDERAPYLYINCNVIYVPEIEVASFSIDVELHQVATLADGQEMPVLTWGRSYLSMQPRDRAAARIRTELGNLIEQFISDYQRAHQDQA